MTNYSIANFIQTGSDDKTITLINRDNTIRNSFNIGFYVKSVVNTNILIVYLVNNQFNLPFNSPGEANIGLSKLITQIEQIKNNYNNSLIGATGPQGATGSTGHYSEFIGTFDSVSTLLSWYPIGPAELYHWAFAKDDSDPTILWVYRADVTKAWVAEQISLPIGPTGPQGITGPPGSITTNTNLQFKNLDFNIWEGIDNSGNYGISKTSSDLDNLADMLKINRASGKLNLRTGINTSIGYATLVLGKITISNTSVINSSLIYLTRGVLNSTTTIGNLGYTYSIGSFTINSYRTNLTIETGDLSTINYWIIN